MFGLPEKTYYGKTVPKNKFYQNLAVDRKTERSFVEQIASIQWVHKLSADTLNVEKGSIVEEVEVMLIKLKTAELDLNVLRQIDKGLHYHLIFILEFEERFQIWTCYKEESANQAFRVGNYYHTDKVTENEFSLKIDGLNMDIIYENLVRQIAGNALAKASEEDLKASVERQNELQKLDREIEKLRAKVRNEKQFNRQVEYNRQLKELLKKREEINNG